MHFITILASKSNHSFMSLIFSLYIHSCHVLCTCLFLLIEEYLNEQFIYFRKIVSVNSVQFLICYNRW